MLRFVSLGSGSRGNALLVESAGSRVLLDCGFSSRELVRRLASVDVDPATIDAVVVTHEHTDHIKGVATTASRYRLDVWMSHGTWLGCGAWEFERLHLFHADQGPFLIGDMEVLPFTIPHDAREPCQFLCNADKATLGILTDAGTVTGHIVEVLAEADALILECNHDETMLAEGPYSSRLKTRVGGIRGHLSNRQAAQLLGGLDVSRLQHLAAAHLSEKNNHPDKVRSTLLEASPKIAEPLSLLNQNDVSDWMEVL